MSVVVCLWCAAQASSVALSKWYAIRANASEDLSAATRAIKLEPADPETYRVRARLLMKQKRFREASVDLSQAVTLSPVDWTLWTELGDSKKQGGEVTDALHDYSRATIIAPGHAGLHWLLANSLLEAGRVDEAFFEFHQASTIKPSLFSQVLELAWQSYKGDALTIERVLQPNTVHEKLSLGMFLSNQGRTEDALSWMSVARFLPEDERASLLKEMLEKQRYEEAYAVWLSGVDPKSTVVLEKTKKIFNGSFEDEIDLRDMGFGWRLRQNLASVAASLDADTAHSGRRSLRIDWRGDPDPSSPVVQQLVLISSKSRYHLSFAARTESLVTACSPVISVVDGQIPGKTLAQSTPLAADKSGWRQYTFEFTTNETTKVVLIGITHQSASSGPCPVFGSTWFDDFSLEKI